MMLEVQRDMYMPSTHQNSLSHVVKKPKYETLSHHAGISIFGEKQTNTNIYPKPFSLCY